MAERVFSTLGHWVTLDDDALDAAIREAGIAHPDAKLRKSARETVCLGAGNAGRAESADHPRAVHAPVAAIPVRGQRAGALRRARRPRPDRDDGARQPRRDARCRRASPTAPIGRALLCDGERRRRHFQGSRARGLPQPRSFHGLDRCCRQRGGCRRADAAALGVDPDDRIEEVEREIVDGPNLPRSRWQDIAARARDRQQDRARAGRAITRVRC